MLHGRGSTDIKNRFFVLKRSQQKIQRRVDIDVSLTSIQQLYDFIDHDSMKPENECLQFQFSTCNSLSEDEISYTSPSTISSSSKSSYDSTFGGYSSNNSNYNIGYLDCHITPISQELDDEFLNFLASEL